MAEVINKPKKFTREWFSYVWCYYKVHILVSLAVIALLLYTVYDFKTTVKYDFRVSYVTEQKFNNSFQTTFPLSISDSVGDINNNGKTDVLLTQLSFSTEVMQDLTKLSAADEKLLTLLVSENEMLFICDKYMTKRILNMEITEGAFLPVAKWADKDAEVLKNKGAYAATLKDSKLLKEQGIDSEELCVMVKMNLNPEDKLASLQFDKSKEIANILIK